MGTVSRIITHDIIVSDDPPKDTRVDQYITRTVPGLTRSMISSVTTRLTVNGKVVKKSRIVKQGDAISITWEEPTAGELVAQDIPLDILYEDEDVIVVNKPQGMVVHPAAGNPDGTLVNALLHHDDSARPMEDEQRLRPGIVHRLDKDTSGVIITAKHLLAHDYLAKQFKDRQTVKHYIAILQGVPIEASGIIQTRIARDPHDRKRFSVTPDQQRGKDCLSVYRVLRRFGSNYALVLLEPKTGRTHQLRVHMKHIGCPILGDPIYGRRDRALPDATLMLHAARLHIRIPKDDSPMTFRAPPPERFIELIRVFSG